MNNDGRHSIKLSTFSYERLRELARVSKLSLTQMLDSLLLEDNGGSPGKKTLSIRTAKLEKIVLHLTKEVGELRKETENKEHTYHLVTREKEL